MDTTLATKQPDSTTLDRLLIRIASTTSLIRTWDWTPNAASRPVRRQAWQRLADAWNTLETRYADQIPPTLLCQTCEEGCSCDGGQPDAGCGHYCCWGPRANRDQHLNNSCPGAPLARARTARTRLEQGLY